MRMAFFELESVIMFDASEHKNKPFIYLGTFLLGPHHRILILFKQGPLTNDAFEMA